MMRVMGGGLSGAMVLFASAGCVTVYHPLASLKRPTLVDPQSPNFESLRIAVRCPVGGALSSRSHADRLCQRVRRLFENQGAEIVESEADLFVELRAKVTDESLSESSYFLSALTLTIVPTVEEQTVAQSVLVRDREGIVLAEDAFEARFVSYGGIGIYGVNWLLDALVRADEDELTGDAMENELSDDLYRQISQLAYEARVKKRVMDGFR